MRGRYTVRDGQINRSAYTESQESEENVFCVMASRSTSVN